MTTATGCKWTAVHRPWLHDQRSTVVQVCFVLSDHLIQIVIYAQMKTREPHKNKTIGNQQITRWTRARDFWVVVNTFARQNRRRQLLVGGKGVDYEYGESLTGVCWAFKKPQRKKYLTISSSWCYRISISAEWTGRLLYVAESMIEACLGFQSHGRVL